MFNPIKTVKDGEFDRDQLIDIRFKKPEMDSIAWNHQNIILPLIRKPRGCSNTHSMT